MLVNAGSGSCQRYGAHTEEVCGPVSAQHPPRMPHAAAAASLMRADELNRPICVLLYKPHVLQLTGL